MTVVCKMLEDFAIKLSSELSPIFLEFTFVGMSLIFWKGVYFRKQVSPPFIDIKDRNIVHGRTIHGDEVALLQS